MGTPDQKLAPPLLPEEPESGKPELSWANSPSSLHFLLHSSWYHPLAINELMTQTNALTALYVATFHLGGKGWEESSFSLRTCRTAQGRTGCLGSVRWCCLQTRDISASQPCLWDSQGLASALFISSFWFLTNHPRASGYCKRRHLRECHSLDETCPQSSVPGTEWLRAVLPARVEGWEGDCGRRPWSQKSWPV